jgi:hypothetical protein
MRKTLLLPVGILMALALGYVLMRNGQNSGGQAEPSEIQGELIQPASPAPETISADGTTNNPPHKRRHPQPPPVQARMLLAQFAPSDPANAGAAMPSGTLGNAADLAKTNLVSAANLPPNHEPIPGFTEISFSALGGFDFALTKEQAEGKEPPARMLDEVRAQIPKDIQSLDGKKVVILGFLLPVRMDDGLAVEFLLMRNQSMCCYGVPPKINEWITVKMTGKGVKPDMDRPIAVAGSLHVGPTQDSGFLTGIYGMDGDKVIKTF